MVEVAWIECLVQRPLVSIMYILGILASWVENLFDYDLRKKCNIHKLTWLINSDFSKTFQGRLTSVLICVFKMLSLKIVCF